MYPTVGVTRDKESFLPELPCWCYKFSGGETTQRLDEQAKADRLNKRRAAGGPYGELSWCPVCCGLHVGSLKPR